MILGRAAEERPPRSDRYRVARGEAVAAYLFLLPNILGFLLFTVFALAASFAISLTNWDLLTPPRFVGAANYVQLLASDATFRTILLNTAVFTLTSVPLAMALGLLAAMALNGAGRGILLFRTAFFMPVVTAGVVVAIIWRWLYNPDFGPLNYVLLRIGIEQPPNWLGDTRFAMPAVIAMAVWKGLGYNMVIYLAGLQAVPDSLYEAATIDGASRWQRFWQITLPLLTPTTFFVLVVSVINSFQVFDLVLGLTDGGPADATRTLVMYIRDQGFVYLRMGYGAAVAWVLFALIFAVTLVQWQVQKRWVHYE